MPCTHFLKKFCNCVQEAPLAVESQIVVSGPDPEDQEIVLDVSGDDDPRDLLEAVERVLRNPDPETRALAEAEIAKAIDRKLARSYFAEYCRQAWKVVEPGTKLEWNWHHELVCWVLQAMYLAWKRGTHLELPVEVRNAVFNLPPGSAKSRLISVFFPTWVWADWPAFKFICLSVNETAALRDARASRDLIKSDWYQTSFQPGWRIKDDQDAVSDYANTNGGARLSRASGSEIVGLRADCVSGGTLVATEIGDITIKDLHEMPLGMWPRVWSQTTRGDLELRQIQATRKIVGRSTVTIETGGGHFLECTPEHKIFTQEGYTSAAQVAGREVSILRRTHLPIEERQPAALRELQVCRSNLCDVLESVPALGRGIRQESYTGCNHGALLQQELQDDCVATSSDHTAVYDVFCGVQDQGQSSYHVFQNMCGKPNAFQIAGNLGDVRLRGHVPQVGNPNSILLEDMCRYSTFRTNEGFGELELQRTSVQNLRWRALGESASHDPGTGQFQVSGVHSFEAETGTTSPPHRLQPTEQCAGEFDHVMRQLSHNAPQVSTSSIQVVNVRPANEGAKLVDVYDIQVEGNHNFFANAVLVHNCLLIDDPNNPHESESKTVRDQVNELWNTNQYNRVNQPERSLRIGVQQRTHFVDWTGYVLALQGIWSPDNQEGWLHIPFAAELDERKFVMPECLQKVLRDAGFGEIMVVEDPRTKLGDSIHPSRWPLKWLAKERQRMRDQYPGQMLQRPNLAGGGKVQAKWFHFFRLAEGVHPDHDERGGGHQRPDVCDQTSEALIIPVQWHSSPTAWDFDWIMLSVDPANQRTENGSNWGMLMIGAKGGRRFVLDDQSQLGDPHEIIDVVVAMIKKWRPGKVLIEKKAAGPTLLTMLQKMLVEGQHGDLVDDQGDAIMVELETVLPEATGDKEERLGNVVPLIKNGLLFLLDGMEWVAEFVREVINFPNYPKNDRVDALSQALAHAWVEDHQWPEF